MKVKITYATELDKVLGEISKQINDAHSEVVSAPKFLQIAADLLKEDQNSALYVYQLIDKIRKNMSQADEILLDISSILEGYLINVAKIGTSQEKPTEEVETPMEEP